MKKSFIRIPALLATAVLLCLCLAPVAVAEDAAEVPETTEEPETKTSVTPAQLQEQGILTVGAKGEDVKKLQQRLKDLGYLNGKVDGQFGGGTKRAVIAFQRKNNLTTDGVAGEETLAKLYSDEAEAAPGDEKTDVLAGSVPMLVNKEYLVDEFFTPADLIQVRDVIKNDLATVKYKKTRGVKAAVEALKTMLEAAKADGVGKKWQISAGYRSWDDQNNLLNAKIRSYRSKNKGWSSSKARRAALRSVAEPGASEHHLGLAFDVNRKGASSFAGTKNSEWLNEHCWEYGFIIRYEKAKEEITGFIAEPWHIRYVGVEHALYMRDHDLCLEEYIQGIEEGKITLSGSTEKETETADEPEEPEEPEEQNEPEMSEESEGLEEEEPEEPEEDEEPEDYQDFEDPDAA